MATAAKNVNQMTVQTPMDLLASAVEKGIDADSLEKLMILQDRYQANQARISFEGALAGFQSECRVIPKSKRADRYNYAPLDEVLKHIRPLLDKYRLSVRFSTKIDSEGMLTAICKVAHVDGHTEDSEFTCPVDAEMRVNAAQKQASANSYARRYALMNALNLVASDDDDDGYIAGAVLITDAQVADLNALIDEVSADLPKFLKWVKAESIDLIPESKFKEAVKMLERKRK